MANYEDRLLREIIKGDRAAFDELVHRHYDALHHFAVLHVKNEKIAYVLVQAIFTRIWYFHKNINPRVSSKHYVGGLIAEVIFNYLKSVGGDKQTRAELWYQAKKAFEHGSTPKINSRFWRSIYKNITWCLLHMLLFYQWAVP